MHIQADVRPASDLSNTEIVAYLFRAIRAQQLKTAKQVQDACMAMFPDLPADRARECMVDLAQALGGQA